MYDYLLDTNTVSVLFDGSKPGHAQVNDYLKTLGQTDHRLNVSAITVGEIEFGHAVQGSATSAEARRHAINFIKNRFHIIDVNTHTAACYGELRANLFERYLPPVEKDGSKRKQFSGRRPEQLRDPVSGELLGIQENDLWLVAQAYERNLILVTHDKMPRLKAVASGRVKFEDWLHS